MLSLRGDIFPGQALQRRVPGPSLSHSCPYLPIYLSIHLPNSLTPYLSSIISILSSIYIDFQSFYLSSIYTHLYLKSINLSLDYICLHMCQLS